LNVTVPVNTAADVTHVITTVHRAARTLQLSEHDLLRAIAAVIDGTAKAFETKGQITVHAEGGSMELLLQQEGVPTQILVHFAATTESPIAPVGLSELPELARTLVEAGNALERSRGMVANLENELDETNRGVMALYAELDDRADKLRRADELKSRFLSYASHELRTPLNGIVGLVRLLRSAGTPRSEDELKQLGFIQSAAEEMREMVNDLLDLAKVEAGKVTIQPSEFDLAFVFGALRGIFRPLLHTDDVTLIFEDTSAVPSIYSDEAKVSQILRNLLSNALKFTERGSVRVSAETKQSDVHIVVADTGIGIPSDQLIRIFEEFSQVDSPLQRRVRGTGLGLPLCRKLAELLGGKLLVESTTGKGSTFTLVLPLDYPAETSKAGTVHRKPKARTRATLLIVDDVEIDRYLLTQLITASGDFEIIQAEDGQAGLEAARREHPDLIFLDVNLPRMDGYGVAEALRADSTTKDIPIYAVTAEKLNKEDRDRLLTLTRGVILKEQLSEAQRLNIDLTAPGYVTLA
jgi:signal transduction histidine kinase